MGNKPARTQYATAMKVALQVRHGNGAVHDTVIIEYFDVAELIRRIWHACVQAARAQDLLLWNEAAERRIVLRSVDCGASSANHKINLIERPELWWHMFNETITPSQVTAVADLVAEEAP